MRPSMVVLARVVLLCSCISASTASAVTLAPIVDGSVRDVDVYGAKNGVADSVLDGGLVQVLNVPSMEDRGLVEFRMSELAGTTVSSAELVLPVFDSNGPFPYAIDVFGYAGDGNLTLSDWSAGSLLASFTFSGEAAVTVDATSFLGDALAHGWAYAGFNLRFASPSALDDNGPYIAFGAHDCPPTVILRVNETPEPGDSILILVGAFSLVGYSVWGLFRRERCCVPVSWSTDL